MTSTSRPVRRRTRSRNVSRLLASRTALVATARYRTTPYVSRMRRKPSRALRAASIVAPPSRPWVKVSFPSCTAREASSRYRSGDASATTRRMALAPMSTTATGRAGSGGGSEAGFRLMVRLRGLAMGIGRVSVDCTRDLPVTDGPSRPALQCPRRRSSKTTVVRGGMTNDPVGPSNDALRTTGSLEWAWTG